MAKSSGIGTAEWFYLGFMAGGVFMVFFDRFKNDQKKRADLEATVDELRDVLASRAQQEA